MDINPGELGKKILIGFILALVVIGALRVCTSSSSTKFSSEPKSTVSENLRYVNTNCYGAFTKEAMNELVRHLNNNNPAGAANQLVKGELVELDKGTQVFLSDYGMTMCKVDVASGPSAGVSVYVLTEFIRK